MAANTQPGLVSQAVRLLPGPLLAVLDAWSHRVARRRARERRQRWLLREQARAAK